jgi:hypothetical protein
VNDRTTAQVAAVAALCLCWAPAAAPDKARAAAGQEHAFAEVLLNARGQPGALRLLLSVPETEVLRTERLPGRPQSSVKERAEARRILHGEQIRSNAVLEGAFVVDPRLGAPAAGRYLDFHVLDPGRTKILRELTVDLVTQKL